MDDVMGQEAVVAEATGLELVAKAWELLGYGVRPSLAKVFVVTEAPPQKIGLIWLPPKLMGFYGGPAHLKLVTATVLSVGPLCTKLKPGDRVTFQRMNFGYISKFASDRYIGFLHSQEDIIGTVEQDSPDDAALSVADSVRAAI